MKKHFRIYSALLLTILLLSCDTALTEADKAASEETEEQAGALPEELNGTWGFRLYGTNSHTFKAGYALRFDSEEGSLKVLMVDFLGRALHGATTPVSVDWENRRITLPEDKDWTYPAGGDLPIQAGTYRIDVIQRDGTSFLETDLLQLLMSGAKVPYESIPHYSNVKDLPARYNFSE